jgi:signal transduction histidine kinase
LGQQLGLYRHLAEVIAMLRQTESELKRQEKIRQRVFEDLSHQLKGPVSQVYFRSKLLLQGTLPADLEHRIRILRGLSRKAQRVTMTTGFFKELAREGEVQLNRKQLKRLQSDEARIRLIEAAIDNEISMETYRDIIFWVNREGFDFLTRNVVMVDIDLFEQAINCLLDNAGKYSFPGTRVDISVGVPRKETAFYIDVKNKGFSIRGDEINKCKEREWRGSYARHAAGEGSGIGLWAVDQIMKAHKGSLIINSTTSDHVTQIRLVFPIST